jgi:hypothetical protein
MNFSEKLNNVEKDLNELTNGSMSFIKNHKKLLMTLAGVYLVYKFLFGEEE